MKPRFLLAPSSLLFAVMACSGASSTELFGPPGSSQFGTEPDTSNDDGSSGTTSPGSSGSSGDTSSSSGSSSGTSSGASGSSSSSGASGSSGSSSGDPKDAGKDAAPSSTGTIHCQASAPGAKTSCTVGTEICCGSWFGQGPPKYECQQTGFLTCAAGTTIACDDKSDCPTGQVCCGMLEDNSGYTSVECKNKCNNIGGLRAVRFCDPNAAIDECAPIGMFCGPSQALSGYHVCRN